MTISADPHLRARLVRSAVITVSLLTVVLASVVGFLQARTEYAIAAARGRAPAHESAGEVAPPDRSRP